MTDIISIELATFQPDNNNIKPSICIKKSHYEYLGSVNEIIQLFNCVFHHKNISFIESVCDLFI